MSEITNFPLYSTKENIVTNYTLFLFNRLYDYNKDKFKLFLDTLIDDEQTVDFEIYFGQQERGSDSIPDGIIEQESFKIILETKRGSKFSSTQIKNHLKSFENEDKQFMLLVGQELPQNYKEIQKAVAEENKSDKTKEIILVNTTFREIISTFKGILDNFEKDMKSLIDDFEVFCEKENIISYKEYRIRAVPSGTTIDLNLNHNVYYMPLERSYKQHRFIGLYNKKSIRGIGKIKKIVEIVNFENKEYTVLKNKNLTDKEKKKIKQIIEEAYERYGHSPGKKHTLFLVENFYETDFKKISKYGLQNVKYFDLRNYIEDEEDLSDVELLADRLAGKTWE